MKHSDLPFERPASLSGRHFSTVIVGAGIDGVGVFRDLSLQGVTCLIVDKGDFGAGASGAPSRMIHGGLRYLESGDLALVAESTRERNLLLRNAPHLVQPLKTVVPLASRFGGLLSSALRFAGVKQAPRTRGLFAVAFSLRLYDLLGRRQRVMPGHRIDHVQPQDRTLFRSTVRWLATYFDAWIRHPEWLILELIADSHRDQPQSRATNYCRLVGCEGKSLTLCDELTGERVRVSADTVVNAAGAWHDHSAAALGGAGSRVMGTKGSHLVLKHPALRDALDGRMAYLEAADGRVCIVYPFLDRVLVGSIDIPVDDPDQVVTEPDIDYLLGVLRERFPRLSFDHDDVVYTFVGVRPLARSGADKPGQISREHSVLVDPSSATRAIPMVRLVGGKWTTFRSLAQEATDELLRLLGRPRIGSTEELPIGGGAEWPTDPLQADRFVEWTMAVSGVSRRRASELTTRYGSKALVLAERFAANGDLPLRHAPHYSASEIRYLCLETGVVHLSDLVIRRTLLAIRGEVTDGMLAEIADLAAQALDWDAIRRNEELRTCGTTLRDRHGVRLAAEHSPSRIDGRSTLDPRTSIRRNLP
ncbi:glycerol-3-phosphate dehydrogenase [Variovorax sp. CF079]|uniref:glycerol-3-phosphate dehydrogenase/oxidase n=1 Tax=Variovorax sp. CF079 TaxID=1882774 RepID=UPI00087E0725|nr:glycerol-3-phosphate dehydrogenase/oxidase [Variovorax sp. CF079]SDE86270.1 glycerol-3-phosphate dehydrogenase [Variovorax sp. CF079]